MKFKTVLINVAVTVGVWCAILAGAYLLGRSCNFAEPSGPAFEGR